MRLALREDLALPAGLARAMRPGKASNPAEVSILVQDRPRPVRDATGPPEALLRSRSIRSTARVFRPRSSS